MGETREIYLGNKDEKMFLLKTYPGKKKSFLPRLKSFNIANKFN